MDHWQGNKIRLRRLEPGDAETFQNWNRETESQRMLDHIWFPTTLAGQKEWTQKQSLEYPENDEVFLAIEAMDTRQIAGSISINSCDKRNGNFSFGVAIIRGQQRKGYAAEAIKIVLNHFFNELRYHKCTVGIFEYNTASIALHESLGFQKEGQLREMKYTKGKYYDLLKYGITRDEFCRIHQ